MYLGECGGTRVTPLEVAKGVGVVLNDARHGEVEEAQEAEVVVDVLVLVVVVEIRHEERAAWRPLIDGRESGGGIFVWVIDEIRVRRFDRVSPGPEEIGVEKSSQTDQTAADVMFDRSWKF
jgi:hypothetical protein